MAKYISAPNLSDSEDVRSDTDAIHNVTSLGADESGECSAVFDSADEEMDLITLVDWRELPFEDVLLQMRAGVVVGERTWKNNVHKEVFVADEAVGKESFDLLCSCF